MTTPHDVSAETVRRIPGAAVVLQSSGATTDVPATVIGDPAWLAEQIRLRGLIWKIDDQRALATLWWYSASTVLVTPTIASLIATGTALSPRLDDLVLHHQPSSRMTGSHSTAIAPESVEELAAALRTTITTVIDTLAVWVNRPRPLWAIASDAIANRFLWAGHPLGRQRAASAQAAAVIDAVGAPMPVPMPMPRFLDVPAPPIELGGPPTARRFLQRSSCCLLYRVPHETACTSCPRRTADDRLRRLRIAAAEDVQATHHTHPI